MRAVAGNYAVAQSSATAPSIAIKAAQCLGVATGWIGPTAGDITVDCMAMAFVVPIDTDPRALAILHEWVKTAGGDERGAPAHDAHSQGADLILNKVSGAPGFCGEHNRIVLDPRPLTAKTGVRVP